MQVNVVSFPGGKKTVDIPPGSTLGDALAAAGAAPQEGEKVDLAIDGQISALDAPVNEGSTVTRTKRVEGA